MTPDWEENAVEPVIPSAGRTPLDELKEWLQRFPEEQPLSPHMASIEVEAAEEEDGAWEEPTAHPVGEQIKSLVEADPTAATAAHALEEAGGRVFAVGGAVRDAIMGKSPKDIDLMVSGLPSEDVNQILEALPGRVDYTGKDFGVFRYKQGDSEVEIALPRSERSTGAGYKDFDVSADHTLSPEEDLGRRDYTANAMAVDLSTGELLDPHGGEKDIKDGNLRAVRPEALSEDPLRVLRGVTAMAKHGLTPDNETQVAMAKNAPSLQHLPQERLQAEIDKMMGGQHTDKALRMAHETGVLPHFLPEVDDAMGHSQNNPHHEQDLGSHLLSVMNRAKQRKPGDTDFALAGLLHDIGKKPAHWTECRDCGWYAHGPYDTCPSCGSTNTSGHFYKKDDQVGLDHETVGAEMARKRLSALRYPNDRVGRISHLVQHHMFSAFTSDKGARKFLNKVGDQHADDLLHLRWADQGGKSIYPTDPSLSIDTQQNLVNNVRDQVAQGQAATSLKNLAVNGSDLLQAGVPQGPVIGQVLNNLLEQVIENPELNNRDTLLGLAQQMLAPKQAKKKEPEVDPRVVEMQKQIEELSKALKEKQEAPAPKPRKLVIKRDAQGKMESIEEA